MISLAAETSPSLDTAGSSFRAASANGIDPSTLLAGQPRRLELVARGATVHETLSALARFGEETLPEMMASVLLFDPE